LKHIPADRGIPVATNYSPACTECRSGRIIGRDSSSKPAGNVSLPAAQPAHAEADFLDERFQDRARPVGAEPLLALLDAAKLDVRAPANRVAQPRSCQGGVIEMTTRIRSAQPTNAAPRYSGNVPAAVSARTSAMNACTLASAGALL